MITIVIVDDHDLVRMCIAKMLSDIDDFEVIGEARNGEEAITLVRRLRPQVILMDIKMPGMGGIEATKKLLEIDHTLNIIAVTSCEDDRYAHRMIRAGAKGYITKGVSPKEMIASIAAVMKGKHYVSNKIARQLALKAVCKQQEQSLFDQLSAREWQTVTMIVNGVKAKSIADTFCISAKTVNSYRYRIFEKLHINSDVELVILAIRYRMFDLDELTLSAHK